MRLANDLLGPDQLRSEVVQAVWRLAFLS